VVLETFTEHIIVCTFLVLIHLLELIRAGLQDFDNVPAQEHVTELSSIQPLSESEIERLEMRRVMSPTRGN
jgi:hypothetical protein